MKETTILQKYSEEGEIWLCLAHAELVTKTRGTLFPIKVYLVIFCIRYLLFVPALHECRVPHKISRLGNGGADMATQMGSSISDFSSTLLKAVVCYLAWVLLAMQCLYTLFLNWIWISRIVLYTQSLLVKVKISERKKCLCCLIYLLFNSALCSWLLIWSFIILCQSLMVCVYWRCNMQGSCASGVNINTPPVVQVAAWLTEIKT